ncbi:arylsulfatase A-like enzyme [Wenyingzhuangia heitensis]|uniref:Arylsulfatase A-like enzyme n=1 Tax=Wenyingzhuangia heitensis TaxID=1487859 RepID=A0ABX0UCF0_9FLAO|nr:arylsulfatase [Wenyingzhuangia heitensis]NIJ45490.1 arylsulfatase A-like enzyme [Wenyingzhuangia heitensis]
MNFIKYIAIVSLAFVSCAKSNTKTESKKPNVILVLTDDQGYGDVGALGNKVIKTPNIDTFHNESYRFTDFHVGPTCAPTRSGLMTGRYANEVGVWHTVGGWSLLRENEKTMADMFTENGYATGGFGKWHLGDNHDFKPENRGFQETVMHGGGGVYQTPDYWGNTYFNDTYFHNGKPQKYEGYCTDVFFNEATRFITENKNKPFFCYIATNAPHGPYNVPVEYYNMYKDIDENTLTDKQKRFYGMITNMDDNFGKLRETLKKLKIADNTILIYMTDNGTAAGHVSKKGKELGYNAGMKGHKGSEFEGGHRVPFFIYWKDGKITGGTDINEMTANLDIMPTLAELCGISLPKDHLPLAGKSLVPLIKKPETKWDRMLVTDSQRIQHPKKWKSSSVMQGKWRLVNGKQLFNVESDKGQNNNVAKQFPEQLEKMKTFYNQWWERVSVKFNEEVYIKVGLSQENPITLTAHDIHVTEGKYPWNQVYVRLGERGVGHWSVDITEDAEYKVSLRRYPIESGLKINDETPAITQKEVPGLENDIPAGKNLNYKKATIQFGNNNSLTAPVKDNALSVDFTLKLDKGRTNFNANFVNQDGEPNVAYYVYIEKL